MKTIFLAMLASVSFLVCGAQSRLATADYNKTPQPAIEIEIPYNEKITIKSMTDKMEKKGYRGKENKGYMVFKGVVMDELGPGYYDLHFKAERRSRKEKDASILTMMISSGNDHFIGDSTDARLISRARAWLDNHTADAEAYDLELQITEQELIMSKADNKLNNLVSDHQSLLKKKEKLEKEIEDNIQKQADQKTTIEKERQILNKLKTKRKQ